MVRPFVFCHDVIYAVILQNGNLPLLMTLVIDNFLKYLLFPNGEFSEGHSAI